MPPCRQDPSDPAHHALLLQPSSRQPAAAAAAAPPGGLSPPPPFLLSPIPRSLSYRPLREPAMTRGDSTGPPGPRHLASYTSLTHVRTQGPPAATLATAATADGKRQPAHPHSGPQAGGAPPGPGPPQHPAPPQAGGLPRRPSSPGQAGGAPTPRARTPTRLDDYDEYSRLVLMRRPEYFPLIRSAPSMNRVAGLVEVQLSAPPPTQDVPSTSAPPPTQGIPSTSAPSNSNGNSGRGGPGPVQGQRGAGSTAAATRHPGPLPLHRPFTAAADISDPASYSRYGLDGGGGGGSSRWERGCRDGSSGVAVGAEGQEHCYSLDGGSREGADKGPCCSHSYSCCLDPGPTTASSPHSKLHQGPDPGFGSPLAPLAVAVAVAVVRAPILSLRARIE